MSPLSIPSGRQPAVAEALCAAILARSPRLGCRVIRVGIPQNSHDRDLDVVNRGQRIEQAVPLLTPLSPDPQLAGRRAEVECRRLKPVDVHRIAQDGEIALLFRQSPREPTPRLAATLATPHCWRAARTRASRRLKRYDVYRVGVVRVNHDGKSEVRRQSFGDRSPRVAVVVAAQHTDARPRPPRPGPICPSAVVLHVEPAGRGLVPRDLVHALSELWIRIGREAGADALIGCPECFATVLAQIVTAGRDAEVRTISVANN